MSTITFKNKEDFIVAIQNAELPFFEEQRPKMIELVDQLPHFLNKFYYLLEDKDTTKFVFGVRTSFLTFAEFIFKYEKIKQKRIDTIKYFESNKKITEHLPTELMDPLHLVTKFKGYTHISQDLIIKDL